MEIVSLFARLLDKGMGSKMKKGMKKWFVDCSLIKKVNLLLIILIVVPIFLFGMILMIWVYKTNIVRLYDEQYSNLKKGVEKIEEVYEKTEDFVAECIQNESLQRIAAGQPIGKDYVYIREWIDELYEKNVWNDTICITLKNGKQIQAGEYVKESIANVKDKLGEEQKIWMRTDDTKYLLWKNPENIGKTLTFYAEIDSYYVNEKELVGTISVRISEEELRSIYEMELKTKYEAVYLINEKGEILSDSETEESKEETQRTDADGKNVLKSVRGKSKGMYWKGERIIFFQKSQLTGWYLIEEIPMTIFYGSIVNVMLLMCCALAACFLFCIIFSKAQKRYLISPIYTLTEELEKTGQASFVSIPDVHRKDEIGMLQNAFNQMNSQLDILINQVYRVSLEKQEAELRALTEQINPHFLYNTLDSIHWKAIRNRDQEVAEQVLALSDVYRYLLNKGNEFLKIRDEVRFQEKYMYLMKKRFGERIEWSAKIAEDTLDLKIPKLIIQPLIENAIVHGIEPTQDGGRVSLRITKEEEWLIIVVEDTGVGFGERLSLCNEEVEQMESAFALKNINRRLKLHYAGQYEYEVQSERGKGTYVRIKLHV